MLRAISALFDIRPNEWPRVLLLYFLGGLFLVGMTWGETISEALFLKQVGVQFLSLTFIADAVIGIVVIAVYASFVDRVSNDKLALGIFAMFVVLIWFGRLLIGVGQGGIAYPFLYLLSHIVRDLFVLHWWTFVIGLYDTRAAKRIAPFLSTAARPAGAIAGLSMPLLNTIFPPQNIILLWSVLIALAGIGLFLMPRRMRETPSSGPAARTTYLQNMREGAKFVSGSTFLRWMALSTLLMTVLFALVNYQTSQILVRELGSVKAVSEFTGALTGWTNLLLLPIQLFVLSRIVNRFGLGNANLIFPFGTLGISAGLAVAPSILTAGAAYFNRTTFRTGFRITLDNLFYNAVPLRVKGRARAFISGLIVPIGSLIGGSLLLTLPGAAGGAKLFPVLIVLLALSYTVSVFIIRRQYKLALVTMLKQEDYSFLLDAAGEVQVSDSATLEALSARLRDSSSPELTVFMAQLLADVGGKSSLPLLVQTARNGSPEVRAAVLDTLTAADLRGAAVQQLFRDSVRDADARVRQSAISGLRQSAGQTRDGFLPLALELSKDPSREVQIEVLPPLIQSNSPQYVADGLHILDQYLSDPDPRWRARGVEVLGQASDARFIEKLLPFVADTDDGVRLEAAIAIEHLSERGIAKAQTGVLADRARVLLADPVERIRQAALTILARLGTPDTPQLLLTALTDPSPDLRNTAVEALVRSGAQARPLLYKGLESKDHALKRMSAIALSRIDRERAVEPIRAFIHENLTAIYLDIARRAAFRDCAGLRSVQILISVLEERNRDRLDEIFTLLAAQNDPKAVRIISDSLAGEDARRRANALEAVESLGTPQIARLLGPIFDRELPPEKLLALSRDASGFHADARGTILALADEKTDVWLRAVMLYALGEIGTAKGPCGELLTRPQLEGLLRAGENAQAGEDVRTAVRAARSILNTGGEAVVQETGMLSAIEKIIFLKEVAFFGGMTIDQLKIVASVAEEEVFNEDAVIFNMSDPGGAVYVVVRGRVALEREGGLRKGSMLRIGTMQAYQYFGEMTLFDGGPRTERALATQDTLVLRLRREPLIALTRQYPDLSLKLINVLSQRLREANDRIAQLTTAKARELHKVFDKLG